MAPFPESEDMTIKRLYVALKRNDTQLLKIGIQKLEEKFHTGHKFEHIDDLKEILYHVQTQDVPENMRSVLIDTLNGILNIEKEVTRVVPIKDEDDTDFAASLDILNEPKEEEKKFINEEYKEEIEPTDEIQTAPSTPVAQGMFDLMGANTETLSKEDNKIDDEEQKTDNVKEEEDTEDYIQEENNVKYETEECNHTVQQDEVKNTYNTSDIQDIPEEEKEENTNQTVSDFIEKREINLDNVAVFYDDKAPFIDYDKNKLYRSELNLISLGDERNITDKIASVKSNVDVQTEEVGEILRMLNMTKGNVSFVTSSKSENIIKSFIENYVGFNIPQITKQEYEGKITTLIPLFGLSNIFFCPKCGAKEYFGGVHNKVLTLQCKTCLQPMYPDINEAMNLETNANPYYWLMGISYMTRSDVWILINPPIEPNKSLIIEFLKTAYEAAKPKKVYIYSKEVSKREFYKQMFGEIYPQCKIKGDYSSSDYLCEDFINSEMSTVKVGV